MRRKEKEYKESKKKRESNDPRLIKENKDVKKISFYQPKNSNS